MEYLKKQFEISLKSKLSQKAKNTQGEESFLARSFKYFDSNNDGAINLNEWSKALEKIGVIIPSLDDLKQLFTLYDLDADGLINCNEFAHLLCTNQPLTHFPTYYTY